MKTNPIRLSLILLISVLFYMDAFAGIKFYMNIYEKALDIAQRENKDIFIDTYTQYCIPCKKMDKVFREKELGDFYNEHYVNIKIDMQEEVGQTINKKYDVFFTPTLLIIDKEGNVKYRSEKTMTAEELLSIGKFLTSAEAKRPPSYASAPKAINPPTSATITKNETAKPAANTITSNSKSQENSASAKPKETEAAPTKVNPKRTEPSINPARGEKILYVLDGDQKNSNPEFLFKEAYFRTQLMDGSHRKVAKEYLNTQDDWTTEKNMKFLFDFLYKTDSPEFEYVIYNRHRFEKVISKERLATTIEILVTQKLHQGVPRPTLPEAQTLLSYVNPSNSRTLAHQYFLDRLWMEGKIADYEDLAEKHLDLVKEDDHHVMNKLAILKIKKGDRKNAKKLIKKALRLYDKDYQYHMTKAKLEILNEDKDAAYQAINEAVRLARNYGAKDKSLDDLKQEIESL